MTLLRLVPVLALAALAAAPAWAGSHRGGVEQLPPNAAPGDCFTRRVTGPGGAYRWERTECEAGRDGWADYDQWGYGRGRLDVETGGDRYGERREARYERRADAYEYERQRIRGYDDGYDQGRGGPVDSYPPSYARGYATAGRDDYGWLVWPGKRP